MYLALAVSSFVVPAQTLSWYAASTAAGVRRVQPAARSSAARARNSPLPASRIQGRHRSGRSLAVREFASAQAAGAPVSGGGGHQRSGAWAARIWAQSRLCTLQAHATRFPVSLGGVNPARHMPDPAVPELLSDGK